MLATQSENLLKQSLGNFNLVVEGDGTRKPSASCERENIVKADSDEPSTATAYLPNAES